MLNQELLDAAARELVTADYHGKKVKQAKFEEVVEAAYASGWDDAVEAMRASDIQAAIEIPAWPWNRFFHWLLTFFQK